MSDTSILIPGATDESVRLLDTLFGINWHSYIGGGSPPEAVGVIFSMLAAFNAVILAGTVAFFSYILIMGAIGTAHEGKPLGQRFSTLYTPLRGALSIALLMPLPWAKGISAIQALLLLFIYYGIGAANYVYSAALDYMGSNAGQVIVLQPPRESVEELAAAIIEIETARHIVARDVPVAGWQAKTWGQGKQIYRQFETPGRPEFGAILLTCDIANVDFCEQKTGAMINMIRDLSPVAEALASQYEGGRQLAIDIDQVRLAIANYSDSLNKATISHIEKTQTGYIDHLQAWVSAAKKEGWISAGQYYWTIAGYNAAVAGAVAGVPTVTPPDRRKLAEITGGESEAYSLAARSFLRLTTPERQALARGAQHEDGLIGRITAYFSTPFSLIPDPGKVMTEGDAVANLQGVGQKMIWTSLYGGGAIAAARISAAAADGAVQNSLWAGVIPGAKETAGAGTGAAVEALKIAWQAAGWIILPVLGLGIALAYYLPAVPFVLWILAVVGWLILVVESLVAAPLWAASHAMPEGEGFAGQHAKSGYMLFMGVLFRPPLMIFGIMSAFLLINAGLSIIGRGFSVFAAGMQAGSVSGLITAIVLYFICGALVIAAVHRIFGLITWLPDNVLRWAGQQVQNLGEQNDADRARVMVAGAVGKVESGAGRAVSDMGALGNVGKNPGRGPGRGPGPDRAQHRETETGGEMAMAEAPAAMRFFDEEEEN